MKKSAKDYGNKQEFLKVRSFKICTGHGAEFY